MSLKTINSNEPFNATEMKPRSRPLTIFMAAIALAIITTVLIIFAHHNLFDNGGLLERYGWFFGITLIIFLTSVASTHGMGKEEAIGGIWDPLLAVLIVGFVCWHIIDAVQRKSKSSFVAMSFFLITIAAIHAIPGFLNIRRSLKEDKEGLLKEHYKHAKTHLIISVVSLVVLMWILYKFYTLIPDA